MPNIRKTKNIKAFLFDRDGVLNYDYGYVHTKKKFKWTYGSKKALKFLNDNNFKIIVVTNQSGIGRGFYKEEDVINLHKFMNVSLNKKKKIIDGFYFCPFHINAKIKKYKKNSFFRKPNPGMILKALKDFNLRKNNCIMIGDKKIDLQAAENAGIRFSYKKKGNLYKQVKSLIQ